MSLEHHLRASDEDRDRVIGALQRHAAVWPTEPGRYGSGSTRSYAPVPMGISGQHARPARGVAAAQIPAAHLNGGAAPAHRVRRRVLALAVIGVRWPSAESPNLWRCSLSHLDVVTTGIREQ